LQNPAEFRPERLNSVPIRCFCPRNYGIYYMYIPAFSGVLPLCVTEANRTGLSIAFWRRNLQPSFWSMFICYHATAAAICCL
jgi:hypothetical protein